MLRVRDLDRSLAFYVGKLGMRVLRYQDFPEGRFTLAFVGFGKDLTAPAIELTHNWGSHEYLAGTGFGHVALAVPNVYGALAALAGTGVPVLRPAGPLKGSPTEVIAFIEDPDGYKIELVADA
jgi:lactoylglutathione lyase